MQNWLIVAAGFSSYLSFIFPALAFSAGHGLLVLTRRVGLVASLGALPGGRDHRAQCFSWFPVRILPRTAIWGQRESIGLGGDVAIGKISC